jgi:hypothetical protein
VRALGLGRTTIGRLCAGLWLLVPRFYFILFSIKSVTECAPIKSASGAMLGMTVLSCRRKVTSWTRNGTVRVAFFPLVYSPTRNRKKNAVVTKSAVALTLAEFGPWKYLCRRKVTSWTRNGTVRVAFFPLVYSPTRNRKKKNARDHGVSSQ